MNSLLRARVFNVVVLFALVMPGRPVVAQPTPDWPAPTTLTRIIKADFTATRISSVLFGAWFGASPVLVSTLGDSPAGVPATTAMHIRPGIVQTEALDTILLKLVDQHRVSLDAPLAKCFPTLRRAKKVTLRMLGNNRSGYGDYLADKPFIDRLNEDPFQSFSADELIATGVAQPMPFLPGAGFKYSHTNAVLLGAALACITHKSVAQLMREMIIDPLHLAHTSVPEGADLPAPTQHLFYRDRGVFEDSTYWNPSWASYSGTVVSTIGDVATMQRAFGSGQLLSKTGYADMLLPTNAKTPPQSGEYYFGLGVIVGNTWILQHAQVAGSDVVMGYLPSRDLTIVVSTATGFNSLPADKGYSLRFFRDAATYLAPKRPVPTLFFGG